jgi:membrane protease YdiL (CAAX protease family)
VSSVSAAPVPESRRLIAPWYHTLIFLLILGALAWLGTRLNKISPSSAGEGSLPKPHGQALLYLSNIAGEWLIVFFIWSGVNNRQGIHGLTGGRWSSWKQAATDVAIAAPFWALWTATAYFTWSLIGPAHGSRGPLSFPPHGLPDILAWLAVSATAGICEEITYRGYLQQQVRAITGSAAVAILVQAILFGLGHTYQGWKPVFVITILGLLYGILAHWRGNIRSAMISHAWSDMLRDISSFCGDDAQRLTRAYLPTSCGSPCTMNL